MSSLIPSTLTLELAPNTGQHVSEVVLQFAVTTPRSGPTSHFLDDGSSGKFSTNTKFIRIESFIGNKVVVAFRSVPQNPGLTLKVVGSTNTKIHARNIKTFYFSLDPEDASTFKISHVLQITGSPYLCGLRTRRCSEYDFNVVKFTQV